MANRFYNFINQLIAGTVAKASEVNPEFAGTQIGFAAVELELNTAIKLPEAESGTDQRITELAVDREGKMLGFDEDGALVVTDEFKGDFSMGGNRLRDVEDATEADEPVNLGQLSSYAAGLTGLPTITGQEGALITDGAVVEWGGAARTIPVVGNAAGREMLVYTSGAAKWIEPQANAAFDPNGILGTGYWNTTLDRFNDIHGPHWTSIAGLTLATFDHKPTAVTAEIPCGSNVAVVASVNVDTDGTTAGAISLVLRYYDSGNVLLSESAATSVTMNVTERNYVKAVTTPASTAYVVAVLKFAAVSCDAYGLKVRNLKVEFGAESTPFNDYKTLVLAYGAVANNYFGSGTVTPRVIIGNATSTTASVDMRSAAGSQDYDVRLRSSGGTNGTPGLGALAVTAKSTAFSGIVGNASEYDAGNSGASITINFATNGQHQKVTLTGATPAITISTTGLVVGKYQLKVVQDGTGGRLPTWVGFVAGDCVGNAFPVMGAGAAAVTFVNLYWDGTQFWVSSNAWDA
jgi:hypothetical protein